MPIGIIDGGSVPRDIRLERNVEIHDSISSDETREVRAMVVVDFLWLLFVAFVVLVRAILLSSGNTPC
jgi:uncharacterized membrane protein